MEVFPQLRSPLFRWFQFVPSDVKLAKTHIDQPLYTDELLPMDKLLYPGFVAEDDFELLILSPLSP